MSAVAENFRRVRERISTAAARAGRGEETVTLVAVSKTHPAEAIRAAYEAGVRHFGENRVQEWESKRGALADLVDARLHLIGHLQSNKARKAARLFDCVDSVDSVALAQKLDAAVAEREEGINESGIGEKTKANPEKLGVLIEVHLSPEEAKSGIEEAGLGELVDAVLALPHLDLRGLMTIPPFFEDAEKARPFFRRLRELRDAICTQLAETHSDRLQESLFRELSMGMSHDFEVAIEEGATQVRVGSALFGARGTK